MKIFLDANVMFTAAYSPDGKANFLIKNIKNLELVLITSDYAAEEAKRNIVLKRAQTLAELNLLLEQITILNSVAGPCPIALPVKDQPIFLTALKYHATHLLTGDVKDFRPFMNNKEKSCGILIQTVSHFISQSLQTTP